MAHSDFYGAHPDYRTRLSLLVRDPKDDVVGAALAVEDLMENEEVHAILGPEWSSQAKFVSDLGVKAQVPIISFSATSPSLSTRGSHYFVRTAYSDSSQVGALAAIVQAYGWREIALVYEDTDYGNGLVPYLVDAFQDVDARISYRSVIRPICRGCRRCKRAQ
ncbi:glutamate receptor 2.4-like [Syzygium oleosum]|uniref:glutamate receptor 2.4-like n=1 Tax=Syzygium oleosum TaxID=219896 RepID=UPI0024B9A512|nr:glutamate receptor 2.4-like [Syzygium oleosum]